MAKIANELAVCQNDQAAFVSLRTSRWLCCVVVVVRQFDLCDLLDCFSFALSGWLAFVSGAGDRLLLSNALSLTSFSGCRISSPVSMSYYRFL